MTLFSISSKLSWLSDTVLITVPIAVGSKRWPLFSFTDEGALCNTAKDGSCGVLVIFEKWAVYLLAYSWVFLHAVEHFVIALAHAMHACNLLRQIIVTLFQFYSCLHNRTLFFICIILRSWTIYTTSRWYHSLQKGNISKVTWLQLIVWKVLQNFDIILYILAVFMS